MSWEIRQGDALEVLRGMAPESVQTCVTSPPYWGLRDYGTAEWEGGDSGCDHKGTPLASSRSTLAGYTSEDVKVRTFTMPQGLECRKCGAKRIDSQLGLEPTPEQYVENLVSVFREVRRVLRDDGTVWLNLGDSYATGAGKVGDHPGGGAQGENWKGATTQPNRMPLPGLKPKDLCGIPWRVAFALQADGWWLRSDIIWSKPNPMPESVTDRPTRAHEYIFLLTKNARYFFDSDAIREEPSPFSTPQTKRELLPSAEAGIVVRDGKQNGPGNRLGHGSAINVSGPNKRSVWEITTQPYPEAHFATFPLKLVEPCILAGSPPKCCGICGKPWQRIVERGNSEHHCRPGYGCDGEGQDWSESWKGYGGFENTAVASNDWRTDCPHDDDPGSSFVLDPFCGSGTAGLVALRHNRSFIGIELNSDYCEMARNRIRDDAPLMNTISEAA